MLMTVVVPTKNSARTLAGCLASVADQRSAEIELVVVDNHSTDETPAIAHQFADRVVVLGPERSAQRNHGARIGTGELLAFVDSDMLLGPGLLAEAATAFAADEHLGALIVDEVAIGDGWLLPSRKLEKVLARGDATVEAGRIFRRIAFDGVGGFAEHLVACEDWELADRVAADGWGTGRLESFVYHDEGTITLGACFAKKRYYGRAASAWVARSVATERRARPRELLMRIARSDAAFGTRCALVMLKVVEWSGFAIGIAEQRVRRRA